jgi:hypothetical protein
VGWSDIDWNVLALDRDRWRALVDTAMNPCVLQKAEKVLEWLQNWQLLKEELSSVILKLFSCWWTVHEVSYNVWERERERDWLGIAPPFVTSALEGGEWSAWKNFLFTSQETAQCMNYVRQAGPRAGLDAADERKTSLLLPGIKLPLLCRPALSLVPKPTGLRFVITIIALHTNSNNWMQYAIKIFSSATEIAISNKTYCWLFILHILRGFSPRANYTYRAIANCRWS